MNDGKSITKKHYHQIQSDDDNLIKVVDSKGKLEVYGEFFSGITPF
jgi:hypothetical protein